MKSVKNFFTNLMYTNKKSIYENPDLDLSIYIDDLKTKGYTIIPNVYDKDEIKDDDDKATGNDGKRKDDDKDDAEDSKSSAKYLCVSMVSLIVLALLM